VNFFLKEMPKVSVLVPCYNVEKYVKECLTSIQQQRFMDIEVICLNDGSKDGTLEILKSFAQRDSRFKIVDKNNSGYGATMNIGLKMSSGKYISIVESDDFIDSEMLATLYEKAEKYNLDISRGCYSRFIDGTDKYDSNRFTPKNIVYTPRQCIQSFREPPSIWAAIYKKDFLYKNKILFLETPGASFQDISFSFKTNLMAERAFCVTNSLLHYRIHSNNSVKKSSNAMIVFDEFNECLAYAEEQKLLDFSKSILLALEYASFKWNYFRVDPESANAFYDAWVKRWRELYRKTKKINFKILLYYYLITKTPSFFVSYLNLKKQD
jgi:glycosyltransferase involved in cell wall biosynthesis